MQGLWAVHFFPEGLQADELAEYHAFLLVGMRTGTKVLRTGEDLDELSAQQADFVLDSRTVFAGNLLQASRIVQVGSSALHPLYDWLLQTEMLLQQFRSLSAAPPALYMGHSYCQN